jgi:hypothetical protein
LCSWLGRLRVRTDWRRDRRGREILAKEPRGRESDRAQAQLAPKRKGTGGAWTLRHLITAPCDPGARIFFFQKKLGI